MGQVERLIDDICYAGKLDFFTIKPLEQELLLFAGRGKHTSTGLSASGMMTPLPNAKVHNPDNVAGTRLRYSRAGWALRETAELSDQSDQTDSDPNIVSADDDYSSDAVPAKQTE
jgi:hypothetical protein